MPAVPFRLVPFDTPPGDSLDLEITGTLLRSADHLDVTFSLRGRTDRVKFAARAAHPTRRDGLWRSTCFELFLKPENAVCYWEYNLAPSGHWNAYRLAGYRAGLQAEAEIADIKVDTALAGATLAGVRARLPIPPGAAMRSVAIGISGVIEDSTGVIHYYALRHAGTKPDFHDPASFTIALDSAMN
jgi:hypothetical protein